MSLTITEYIKFHCVLVDTAGRYAQTKSSQQLREDSSGAAVGSTRTETCGTCVKSRRSLPGSLIILSGDFTQEVYGAGRLIISVASLAELQSGSS